MYQRKLYVDCSYSLLSRHLIHWYKIYSFLKLDSGSIRYIRKFKIAFKDYWCSKIKNSTFSEAWSVRGRCTFFSYNGYVPSRYEMFCGPDTLYKLLTKLIGWEHVCIDFLKHMYPMRLSRAQEEEHEQAYQCYICR